MIEKLALGTVQFGLQYGIANAQGKTSRNEVFEILDKAGESGISLLDTAGAYGESESIIGEYIADTEAEFDLVTKITIEEGGTFNRLEEELRGSLERLKGKKIYGLLLHRFDDYLNNIGVWDMLIEAKKRGLVEKIGFSLYHPHEAARIFEDGIAVDILQIPYSIFDQRFDEILKGLNERSIEIHARSIFLQGLFYMSADRVPGYFKGAAEQLEKLRTISSRSGVPIGALCLNFVLCNENIDKGIIGVESLGQLNENLVYCQRSNEVEPLIDELSGCVVNESNIILPYLWPERFQECQNV